MLKDICRTADLMMVKRVSYFTFIVAITTIATVGSCHKVKAATNRCPEQVQTECLSVLFEEISRKNNWPQEATLQLAKVLQEKGLLSGRFHIRTRYSGSGQTFSIYLTFDKSYKGEVSACLFNGIGAQYQHPLFFTYRQEPVPQSTYTFFDKREDIDRKNLILLE